jgi:hypothetical protein
MFKRILFVSAFLTLAFGLTLAFALGSSSGASATSGNGIFPAKRKMESASIDRTLSLKVTAFDEEGCCIQWVPGQAKGCSRTTQNQCKADSEAVGAKWSWHAGECQQGDDCH